MKFSDKAKALQESEEFSEAIKNFTRNVIDAAMGDVIAAAGAMKFIFSSPMFIRECLFWEKFAMYIDGVFLDDDDIKKLSEIFADKEEKEEYSRRIIKVIDDIDLKVKVLYINNLTRSLLSGFIVKPDYFRLINVIKDTLEEDLQFVKKEIVSQHLKANIHFEFLKQNGLAIQTVISDQDSDDGDEYKFTPLAHMLDQYGLSYGNERYQYSIPSKKLSEQPILIPKVGPIVAKLG